MAEASPSLLRDGVVLLGFGLMFVLLFRRLGLGATLGYLVAGAVVGPHVLGLVGDAESKLGFGALKGLILASLVFLLATLVIDTMGGGPSRRPGWMTTSRTYPLLNATSASIADFVDRRRRGKPVFGATTPSSRSDTASEPKP